MRKFFENFFTDLAVLFGMLLVVGIIIGLPVLIITAIDSWIGTCLSVILIILGLLSVLAYFDIDVGCPGYHPPFPGSKEKDSDNND